MLVEFRVVVSLLNEVLHKTPLNIHLKTNSADNMFPPWRFSGRRCENVASCRGLGASGTSSRSAC